MGLRGVRLTPSIAVNHRVAENKKLIAGPLNGSFWPIG
jgi:hypothetical protein